MADRRGTKHNPHSRKAMIHRRQRAVGLTGAISAFLTLGLGLLANAPKATADVFDVVIDQVLNAITDSSGDVAAGAAAVPELGSLGLGATESTAGVGLGSLSDAGSVAAASLFNAGLHGLEQDWINSGGFVQQVDTALNDWFNQVDPTAGVCGLVCNGVDAQGAQPMSQNLLVDPGFET
ncbi:MAG: hypothetical protein ACRDTV_07830, partial [Mycobacterium sp.]